MTDRYPDQATAYAAGRADLAKELVADREQQKPRKQQSGKKPIRTLADVHALSPSEVNERWDDVQRVLGAS